MSPLAPIPATAARPEYPIWALCIPGVAALLGTAVFAADIGRTGTTVNLDLGAANSFWIISYVAGLVALAAGAAVGYLGRRFPASISGSGIAVMVIGVTAMGFTPGGAVYLLGKVIAGLGAGLGWGVAIGVVLATGERKRMLLAALSGLGVLFLLLGPLVADIVTTALGWRIGYFITIPLLLVALILVVALGIALHVTRQKASVAPAMQAAHMSRDMPIEP